MQTAHPAYIPSRNRTLTIAAWGITLLISTLPDIVFTELTHYVPAWLIYGKMGLLLAAALAAVFWKPLRSLRNFFLIMIVFFGLAELRPRFDFSLPFLQNFFGGSVFDVRMQAEQTGKLAVSAVMILALLLLGYTFRDTFLVCGNLRAPMKPVHWMGFPKASPWYVFALQWAVYIAAALAVMQFISLKPDGETLLKVLPILPSILFYAALNAFNEEVTYRSSMLATLEHAVGSQQALWMAAYFFGIGHYFGTPGGIIGGILSIFMGWILGKGMIETRGFFWTWWIHFLSDVAIFFFLVAALVR